MDFLEKNCKNKKTKWIAGEFLGIFYLSTNLTSYKELRNVYLEFFYVSWNLLGAIYFCVLEGT